MGNSAATGHAMNLCGCTDHSFEGSAKMLIAMHSIEPWNARELVKHRLKRQSELAQRSPLRRIPIDEGLRFMRKKMTSNVFTSDIGKDSFVRACTQLFQEKGIPHTSKDKDDLYEIFDSMDFDGSGALGAGEWAGGLSVFFKGNMAESVRAVFSVLDKNGDKKLSKKELQEYLKPFVKAMSPPDADALRPLLLKKATDDIYSEMDVDHKDDISCDEMLSWTMQGNNIVDRLASIIDKEVYQIVLHERDSQGKPLSRQTPSTSPSSAKQGDLPSPNNQVGGGQGGLPQSGYQGGFATPHSGSYADQLPGAAPPAGNYATGYQGGYRGGQAHQQQLDHSGYHLGQAPQQQLPDHSGYHLGQAPQPQFEHSGYHLGQTARQQQDPYAGYSNGHQAHQQQDHYSGYSNGHQPAPASANGHYGGGAHGQGHYPAAASAAPPSSVGSLQQPGAGHGVGQGGGHDPFHGSEHRHVPPPPPPPPRRTAPPSTHQDHYGAPPPPPSGTLPKTTPAQLAQPGGHGSYHEAPPSYAHGGHAGSHHNQPQDYGRRNHATGYSEHANGYGHGSAAPPPPYHGGSAGYTAAHPYSGSEYGAGAGGYGAGGHVRGY